MSTLCTIAQALELLTHSQSDRESTVDIVGIVGSIVTSSPSNRVPKSEIWLLDESSNGVRFVLYGESDVARTKRENIQTGDILRFNRVAFKSFGGSTYFSSSSADPEPFWFRLGNVDDCCSKNDSQSLMPKSMITSLERITNLADFYKSQRPPLAPSALPTRKRRFNEISVGQLSHLTVRVSCVRIEQAFETNKWGETKQRKGRPPVIFASLMDESGAQMSFVDDSGRFVSKLKLAHTKSHTTKLIITNVLTQDQSTLRASKTSANDLVLVPTDTTTLRLITEEKTLHNRICQTTEEVVRSGIADISVNGLSLKRNQSFFSSRFEYLKTIEGTNGNFQKAMVYFETNDSEIGINGILASSGVMKTLCGSLDILELANNEKLCTYSMQLLQNFLQNDIILEWTLTKDENNKMEIVKATLHHVPN